MITQTYKLNIIPRAERAVRGMTPPTVNVSQYDKGLRTLVFDLYDGANGRLTLLGGHTAKIYGKKPDANVFEYDMTVSEDKQSVSIVLQEQMAVIAGCVECEVRIIQGVNTVGSANFKLIVEPAPVGADEVYSESEIPEIDNLLYGGTAGQVFTKTSTGARWADIGTDSGLMMKSEYDPNDTGSVLKADHADDADTVDGHTVARDVLANEYTNEQIDSMMQAAGTVKTVNSVQPDQNGNVQISKADIGLGNVDNTSDADKPVSTAAQAALDLKVDKVSGKGLSTNDYTDAEKNKLADLPTDAELTAELAGKVDKETGKGLSTNDFTDAEKTKLQDIEAGAQVNTVTGVKGSAESTYRTGNIDITKANIGLGNVDNTSDLNKPISTATQAALDQKVDKVAGKGLSTNDFTTAEKEKLAGIAAGAEVNVQANWNEADSTADDYIKNKPSIPTKTSDLTNDSGYITGVNWGSIGGTLADQIDLNNELSALNTGLSSAVKSINTETPDANGNVAVNAENIPAQGYGNESTSGNPITITDGMPSTVKNLDVSLEPIQSGSGTPSPDNIRPISGYDSVSVQRTGFNLWDEEIKSNYQIDGNGVENYVNNRWCTEGYIPVLPNTSYYLRSPLYLNARWYDADKNYIGYSVIAANGIFTPSNVFANARFLRFNGYEGATYNNDICINISDPAKNGTYEPYSGSTATISLTSAGTVYGGTLDFDTGMLTVTDANIASYNGETLPSTWISDRDVYSAGGTPTTGAQVVYKLATPTTYQLTPAQLTLIKDYNYITSNGTTISLDYYGSEATNVQAEIVEFETSIDRLTESLATIETSPATATHAVGDLIVWNSQLYKVTSAIAVGETITIGTNVSRTTIADELKAIIAQLGA